MQSILKQVLNESNKQKRQRQLTTIFSTLHIWPEEFFGLSFFSGGFPVGYATYYPKPAIALCTSKPAERLQQWPSILESLLQAETVQEQYKIVRSAFISCCNTTQAVLEGLEQLETK